VKVSIRKKSGNYREKGRRKGSKAARLTEVPRKEAGGRRRNLSGGDSGGGEGRAERRVMSDYVKGVRAENGVNSVGA